MIVLCLIPKKYWDNKMSRVRFHAIDGIARHSDISLIKDGPGFPGWLSADSSVSLHKPDVVFWYKPLEINGYEKVTVPKIIAYNEMYDIKITSDEILKSNSNLIICHLANDIKNYSHLTDRKFIDIPHCIEQSIFKDWELPKEYDIAIAGIQSPIIYPLRHRLLNIIKTGGFSGYKTKVLAHPGYKITDVNEQVVKYAKELNKAKIVLSCTSKYKYALAKHVEIPACGSLLIADLPDERHDLFNSIMVPINAKWDDYKIRGIVIDWLKNDTMRNEKIKIAYDIVHGSLTQDHYAQMFYRSVMDFLNKK